MLRYFKICFHNYIVAAVVIVDDDVVVDDVVVVDVTALTIVHPLTKN